MACIVSRPQNTHEIAEPMRMGPRIAVTSGIGDAGVAIAKNLSGMGRKGRRRLEGERPARRLRPFSLYSSLIGAYRHRVGLCVSAYGRCVGSARAWGVDAE